ncbi:MAG TPA: tRNA (adenosine(37)-N6)-dimethylallyltransferase MiaA [Gemmatimonadaceae bacterium]|nr:tRNA (adenosine(37)-N6)-dimethylallyltransferase MiaA [Gemmatimonadaceae bacterium]
MSSIDVSDASSVRVICGPTGAGKSALAIELAERYDAIILSADSRQIYRGFDVGTAKPTARDQSRVPHRGIDVADPAERYSAARWADEARSWMADARAAGRPVVIVGGTGFYLRALTEPLFEAPAVDAKRRAALEDVLQSLSTDELRRWCRELDAPRAHLGRTQLVRSVETALLVGERLSDLHRSRARAPEVRARYLVVDPGPGLSERIARRFDAMMADGWADEVEALAQRVDASAPAWRASGYLAVREMVGGRMTREAARQRVIIETRQYAKRQRTWFRHQLEESLSTRIDPDDARAARVARDWWEGKGRSE